MVNSWRLPKQALNRLFSAPWRAIPNTTVDRPTRWVPVIRLGRSGKLLGVMPDGTWAVGKGDDPRPLQEGWHVPLLPILESSHAEWVKELSELRAVLPDVAEAVEHVVQIEPLLRAAVDGEGDYWPELAIRWLESTPELPIPTAALSTYAEAGKRKPQALRHRARSLLTRTPASRREAP